jgi:hypothetical protein
MLELLSPVLRPNGFRGFGLWPLFGTCFVLLAALSSEAAGQSATERAGSLKVWREQCNDPDIDLRIAYVEQAIESGDVTIQRICARLALESDDADIRNLGLRAAIASLSQISFDVEMPSELAAAYRDAGDDEKEINEIDGWYLARDYAHLRTGLVFLVERADVNLGTSKWYPLVALTGKDDRRVGNATIIGSDLTWIGSARLSAEACKLDVQLEPGSMLVGTFQCERLSPFPVRAKVL